MNVKKTVKKLVALGTGATMVGATIMGAMADLSTYPEPFVSDGVIDTLIVIGSEAKAMDTLGAVDIAASLQAAAVSPVDGAGTTGTTTVTGDAFKIGRGSDMLEINETIGDVSKTITENDLQALAGGTVTAGAKTTKFNQYLKFNFDDPDGTTRNSGRVLFGENRDDEVGDFIYFNGGVYMFEYQLEFAEGLQSDVGTSNDLEDIENEAISIFGTDYTIVDTTVGTNTSITLKMMGGEVTDTLGEQETKTYTINGVPYEVTAVFISDQASAESVKFSVNGDMTKELGEGETDVVQGDMEIGVRSILTNQREGIAEFYLGANKIELQDNHFDDDAYYQGVDIGGETIDDARIKIKASLTTDGDSDGVPDATDKLSISSLHYQVKADLAGGGTDIYVPPGKGLRELMDEPEGLLNPTWDIKYEGLVDVETFPINFDAKGDDKYELTFTNAEGIEYTIPIAEVDSSTFYFGTKDETVWMTEFPGDNYTNFSILEDDYFVVNDRNDEAGVTKVLTFDSVDTSNNQIYITDVAGGTKKVTYTGTPTTTQCNVSNSNLRGQGDLIVGGNTYTVYLCGEEASGSSYPWALNVDLNGDSAFSNNSVVNITTMGGAMLEFFSTVQAGNLGIQDSADGIIGDNYNVTIRILKSLFDENGPNDDNVDATHDVNILRSSNKADLAFSSNYASLYEDNENEDWEYTITPFGAYVRHNNPSTTTDANSLIFEMPKVQRGPEVFLTAGTVKTTKTGGSDGGAVVVNPTSVGISVLDSTVSLGQGNMIVVGGPCVNTIAQELMGNPENCAEGFEPGKAVIKLYEDQNALLVAGYGWEDTLGAAYVLADYEEYDLSGTEMEVVVAGLDSISVSRVE